MNRAGLEITAPINRDELHRLLNTMTPAQQQAITTRACISDIEAELARYGVTTPKTDPAPPAKPEVAATTDADVPRLFSGVDWDNLLTATVSTMVTPRTLQPVPPPIPRSSNESSRPKRKYARPFSQVAALLPPRELTRAPRVTRPPPMKRATTQSRSLAVAEHKAPRTVAELRARLDSGETAAQWADSCELSPQVLAHLSAEEIAMLPAEIRGALPEVSDGNTPPPIEMTSVPGAEVIEALVPAPDPQPQRFAAILASLAFLFLVAICAVYVLV